MLVEMTNKQKTTMASDNILNTLMLRQLTPSKYIIVFNKFYFQTYVLTELKQRLLPPQQHRQRYRTCRKITRLIDNYYVIRQYRIYSPQQSLDITNSLSSTLPSFYKCLIQ